jgi:hypothetical protein
MSGDPAAAADAYRMAARYETNGAERRYLDRQSRRFAGTDQFTAGRASGACRPARPKACDSDEFHISHK